MKDRHAMSYLHIPTLAVAFYLLPNFCLAQRNLDVGFFFGVSHYMGDLQRSHVEVLEMHQAKGLFLRYNTSSWFSVKGYIYQGVISGNDAHYPTIESAWKRNLHFRSTLYEAGIIGEFNFMNFGERKQPYKRRQVSYVTSAYLFGGIAGFYFNPQASYQGKWYDLQPLGTEGQGLPGQPAKYHRFQVAVPMGFGFKIRSTKWSCIGVEAGLRKTFTDYLDDVSGQYPDLKQLEEVNPVAAILSYRSPEIDPSAPPVEEGSFRGSPNGKDLYFFAGLSLAITLGK